MLMPDKINRGRTDILLPDTSDSVGQTDMANFSVDVSEICLDEATFLDLSQRSGWHRMTSNALQDDKRRPHVLNPKPLVITIRDDQGRVIAARGGINLGAYAYGQYAMVAEEYQGKGLGTLLLKRFQEELKRINGGETSIAIFAHPESQAYYQRRGFVPLENAFVLKRGTSVACPESNIEG